MPPLAFAAATLAATLPSFALEEKPMTPMPHPYVGLWVTDDGRIRHELLPDNRYDEAPGTCESAYRGRYEVTGTDIEYMAASFRSTSCSPGGWKGTSSDSAPSSET